jgi:hypothetical protein
MRKRKGNRPAREIHVARDESSGAPGEESQAEARRVGRAYFSKKDGESRKDDPEENRRSARSFLIAAVWAAVLIPGLFFLEFGEIDVFALSFTGFVVVLCLLVALGFAVPDRPAQQVQADAGETRAAGKVGLLNYVGAFWLLACAFGPFFGWLLTASAFPLTEGNWWWRYAARAVLSVGAPVLTALPLFVYVRGRYWHVALLLLVGLTALAAWSGMNTVRDLREGPSVRQTNGFYDASQNSFSPSADGRPYRLKTLAHTGRTIKIEPATPDAGAGQNQTR